MEYMKEAAKILTNVELCETMIDLKNGHYEHIPVAITLLALVILNIHLWDKLPFSKNSSNLFKKLLPLLESIGHWIVSNFLITVFLHVNRFVHKTFTQEVTIVDDSGLWDSIIQKFSHQEHEISKTFPYIPFFIMASLSFVILLGSLFTQKKVWRKIKDE